MPILQRFRDQPIRRKVMLLLLATSAVGLVMTGVALVGFAWITARAKAIEDLETLGRIVADNTSAALVFSDRNSATETLAALRANQDIEQACLYQQTDGAARLFAHYAPRAGHACPAQMDGTDLSGRANRLAMVLPVELNNETIGVLQVTLSLQPLRDALATQAMILVIILAVSFVISLLLGFAMQRVISRPILALAQTARRISESRDYSLRATAAGRDEVGRLIDDFNQMLAQIKLRDEEIGQTRDALYRQVREKTAANQELEQALNRLKEAQAQLVQSEKLASLGALVAGIAHEINTPVGVSVTAASTLQSSAHQLKDQYAANALKRSDLERFVTVADESARILLKNLHRAADLIHSFKQVAVDQSSGEARRFGLRSYIDEVLLSLAPRLRKSGHSVDVDCRESLMVESYPGALAQILTNFVSNSLLHAWEPGQRGHIRIAVESDNGWITLKYADDGRGIPREHQSRIFDPFFTTKRGAGGSGLGMHVVYNLVTQVLGGSIQMTSEPGQGVEFTVRFPADVRRAAA